MRDDQKLDYFVKQYDSWKSYRIKNYDPKWYEVYRLYKSFRENRLNQWQTQIFLSYAFSLIETVFPRIIDYVYRGDRFVKAHPRGEEDYQQAEVVDNLIQWQIDTQIENLFLEQAEQTKSTLVYGTGIGKLTQNVMKGRPEYNSLDIFDFVCQPYKKYINEMDGMYQVYDKFVDVLYDMQKQGVGGYKNIEYLLGTKHTKQDEEDKEQKAQHSGKQNRYETQRDTALIYEYWGKCPVQDTIDVDAGYSSTRYEEKLVLIANRKYIIREIPNPYITPQTPEGFKPFIASKNYLDPQEFYGIGEIEVIKDLQHEANEMEANFMDNLKLLINRMWKVSTDAGIDLGTLYSYPGAVFQVNPGSLDKLEPIDHRDIPQSYFKAREGMTDTVGGITSLIEEANMRFGTKIKVLQMSSISDFARKLFMLDKIFIRGADLPVRLQGEQGYEWAYINEDNLKGMYDFKPVGISMVGNKMARQNTLIRLLDVLSKSAPIPPVVEQILDEYDIKNKAEIMKFLYQMWGMPPEGTVPPPVPVGGIAGGTPLRQQPAPLPPGSNAQIGQNLSRQLGAGVR
jgi:hypothetical protein